MHFKLQRQKFFKSSMTLTKKKQLVLKAEKKYEDCGENVTVNVIWRVFSIIFFLSLFFFYNLIAIILPHSVFPMKPNSPGIELLPM